eukprot:TRINITY_DN14648_c0_g1_i1.p1 TRINITY_DN14648_c0_g1~~TRINITY_DN14648_c0_g1_i1.p1  ORF type:complete len:323 (-),score=55.23 TRINITY_DN14648_c0_g1_i1:215-1183(-)
MANSPREDSKAAKFQRHEGSGRRASELGYVPATKAYVNREFLFSASARPIRILCEYEETKQRLSRHKIYNTIVFFGSARTKPLQVAQKLYDEAVALQTKDPENPELQRAVLNAKRGLSLAPYYEMTQELARKLTEWVSQEGKPQLAVCTGGGPGMMEAANRGAKDANGKSLGLSISLPFETGCNKYVDPELSFQFHYFFTRKYYLLYHCRALVITPGGFGTLDELFEALTLIQTGKIKKPFPIVLLGASYWKKVINFEAMLDAGMISDKDMERCHFVDSVEEAFTYITAQLEEMQQRGWLYEGEQDDGVFSHATEESGPKSP